MNSQSTFIVSHRVTNKYQPQHDKYKKITQNHKYSKSLQQLLSLNRNNIVGQNSPSKMHSNQSTRIIRTIQNKIKKSNQNLNKIGRQNQHRYCQSLTTIRRNKMTKSMQMCQNTKLESQCSLLNSKIRNTSIKRLENEQKLITQLKNSITQKQKQKLRSLKIKQKYNKLVKHSRIILQKSQNHKIIKQIQEVQRVNQKTKNEKQISSKMKIRLQNIIECLNNRGNQKSSSKDLRIENFMSRFNGRQTNPSSPKSTISTIQSGLIQKIKQNNSNLQLVQQQKYINKTIEDTVVSTSAKIQINKMSKQQRFVLVLGRNNCRLPRLNIINGLKNQKRRHKSHIDMKGAGQIAQLYTPWENQIIDKSYLQHDYDSLINT